MSFTGVFPVYKLEFKVGKLGRESTTEDFVAVADMETFSLAIDGVVQDWTPMNTDGWVRRLMTGKGFTVSLNGKRHIGDEGNDYVADMAWKDGLECSTMGEIVFPDGAKLAFDCVIDVKNVAGADSTDVGPLEFDMMSDGKPDYTPAAPVGG